MRIGRKLLNNTNHMSRCTRIDYPISDDLVVSVEARASVLQMFVIVHVAE
jgi:hypothetical protein